MQPLHHEMPDPPCLLKLVDVCCHGVTPARCDKISTRTCTDRSQWRLFPSLFPPVNCLDDLRELRISDRQVCAQLCRQIGQLCIHGILVDVVCPVRIGGTASSLPEPRLDIDRDEVSHDAAPAGFTEFKPARATTASACSVATRTGSIRHLFRDLRVRGPHPRRPAGHLA